MCWPLAFARVPCPQNVRPRAELKSWLWRLCGLHRHFRVALPLCGTKVWHIRVRPQHCMAFRNPVRAKRKTSRSLFEMPGFPRDERRRGRNRAERGLPPRGTYCTPGAARRIRQQLRGLQDHQACQGRARELRRGVTRLFAMGLKWALREGGVRHALKNAASRPVRASLGACAPRPPDRCNPKRKEE